MVLVARAVCSKLRLNMRLNARRQSQRKLHVRYQRLQEQCNKVSAMIDWFNAILLSHRR